MLRQHLLGSERLGSIDDIVGVGLHHWLKCAESRARRTVFLIFIRLGARQFLQVEIAVVGLLGVSSLGHIPRDKDNVESIIEKQKTAHLMAAAKRRP